MLSGVCRPANQTPKASFEVERVGRADGEQQQQHTPPAEKVHKARNSGIFRPLCLLILLNFAAHTGTSDANIIIRSRDERRRRDSSFITHTQDQLTSRERWLTCKWESVSSPQSAETIGQRIVHTNTRLVPNNWNWCRFGPTTQPHDTRPQLLSRWPHAHTCVFVFCVSPAQINTCLSGSIRTHPWRGSFAARVRLRARPPPPAILPPIYGLETNSARRPAAERDN